MDDFKENGGFEPDPNETWTVYDMNAPHGTGRTHDAGVGVSYELFSSKGTEMPRHHAAVFLKDPAFRVLNARKVRVTPLPQVEADVAQARRLELAEDECVARFEELTDAALLARVASRPGGEETAIEADRTNMIAFLKKAPRSAELPRHLRARDTSTPEGQGDGEADELGDAAAKAMLIKGGSRGARDPLAMGG